jgi:hypothetical protein
MRTRRPTSAEMGDEVTIAIVALTAPSENFICVSDRMISHDDILPADDNALIKNLALSQNWSVAFSANKIENALPLLERVRSQIVHPADTLSADLLQDYFTDSIGEVIRTDFFNLRLRRYGYGSMNQFRREGQADLGEHFFELCRELDSAELGVEFIVYGYEGAYRGPCLFEINGKGQVIDRMALRYAVVGSGYWMASASLKRKPLAIDFDSMLYRVLEAKFSAETASGVGKTTTVTFKRRDMHDMVMRPNEIEKMRAVWEGEMRKHEPTEALQIAGKIHIEIRKQEQERAVSARAAS